MSSGRAGFQLASQALGYPTSLPAARKPRPVSTPRGLSKDIIDYTIFLPCVWIVCGFGYSLRIGGPLIVVVILIMCVSYAILRGSLPPKLLTAYIAACIIAGILSHYRLFPSSWQVHFRDEAIPRQLAPVMSFFAMAWASKAYFERRLRAGDAFSGGSFIIFLSFIVAPIILFKENVRYEGDDPESTALAMYGSFTNNIIIAMFFVSAGAFAGTGWRRYAGIGTIVAIVATTHFAQFRVMTAAAAAILMGAPGRMVALAFIAALTGLYVTGLFYIPEMMLASPNSGIRLAFITDAFRSIVDTYGLGIGYGTESVRWRYYFPDMPVVTFLPDPATITPARMLEVLSTGVHNSLIQALLRTGIPGFALLLAAFAAAYPARSLPREMRNHAAILFIIMFIACFVNPALESPVQGIGVGFVYGYLVALRSFARSRATALPRE